MKIFGNYRPSLRTSIKYRFKPFLTLSLLFILFLCFQNFSSISENDGSEKAKAAINPKNRSIVFKNISEARAFQTSNGAFNIIKGDDGRAVEVDYLSEFDVSGKNCLRLAQMAAQTGQHLKVIGVPASLDPKGIVMFQRVIDCKIEPLTEKTAGL